MFRPSCLQKQIRPPRFAGSIRRYSSDIFKENDIVLAKRIGNKRTSDVQCIGPLNPRKSYKFGRLKDEIIAHGDIIGKRPYDLIEASKKLRVRCTIPTLGEYVTFSERIVTPIYPQDANLIVSLLDLHPTVPDPTNPSQNSEKLEIFEAGTGHGSLTLHLARAIYAANPPSPQLPKDSIIRSPLEIASETASKLSEYHPKRRAVITTLDISEKHSSHARTVIKRFRNGIYYPHIDFKVGTIDEYISSRLEKTNGSPFLDHAILDLPNSNAYIDIVSKALKPNGTLITFCPQITQILESLLFSKKKKLPLVIDKVLESGNGIGVGGREWDVGVLQPRTRKVGAVAENTISSVDNEMETPEIHVTETSVLSPTSKDGWDVICRPKVGTRVTGGGFLGVWKKLLGEDADNQRLDEDGVEKHGLEVARDKIKSTSDRENEMDESEESATTSIEYGFPEDRPRNVATPTESKLAQEGQSEDTAALVESSNFFANDPNTSKSPDELQPTGSPISTIAKSVAENDSQYGRNNSGYVCSKTIDPRRVPTNSGLTGMKTFILPVVIENGRNYSTKSRTGSLICPANKSPKRLGSSSLKSSKSADNKPWTLNVAKFSTAIIDSTNSKRELPKRTGTTVSNDSFGVASSDLKNSVRNRPPPTKIDKPSPAVMESNMSEKDSLPKNDPELFSEAAESVPTSNEFRSGPIIRYIVPDMIDQSTWVSAKMMRALRVHGVDPSIVEKTVSTRANSATSTESGTKTSVITNSPSPTGDSTSTTIDATTKQRSVGGLKPGSKKKLTKDLKNLRTLLLDNLASTASPTVRFGTISTANPKITGSDGATMKVQPSRSKFEPCGNCGKTNHQLLTCTHPLDSLGFINGCPICNSTNHTIAECTVTQQTNWFRVCVSRRKNKAPIRSPWFPWELSPYGWKRFKDKRPHTPAFAKQLQGTSLSDEQKAEIRDPIWNEERDDWTTEELSKAFGKYFPRFGFKELPSVLNSKGKMRIWPLSQRKSGGGLPGETVVSQAGNNAEKGAKKTCPISGNLLDNSDDKAQTDESGSSLATQLSEVPPILNNKSAQSVLSEIQEEIRARRREERKKRKALRRASLARSRAQHSRSLITASVPRPPPNRFRRLPGERPEVVMGRILRKAIRRLPSNGPRADVRRVLREAIRRIRSEMTRRIQVDGMIRRIRVDRIPPRVTRRNRPKMIRRIRPRVMRRIRVDRIPPRVTRGIRPRRIYTGAVSRKNAVKIDWMNKRPLIPMKFGKVVQRMVQRFGVTKEHGSSEFDNGSGADSIDMDKFSVSDMIEARRVVDALDALDAEASLPKVDSNEEKARARRSVYKDEAMKAAEDVLAALMENDAKVGINGAAGSGGLPEDAAKIERSTGEALSVDGGAAASTTTTNESTEFVEDERSSTSATESAAQTTAESTAECTTQNEDTAEETTKQQPWKFWS